MPRKVLEPGDCWMFHDPLYEKGISDPDYDVRVIRYDRPVIVLQVYDNGIATVVPLSTKIRPGEALYTLQIQEGKWSFAPLSQITSVEHKYLNVFIGRVNKDVLEDIRRNCIKMLYGGMNAVPFRNIPMRYNNIDVRRFYPFHVYYNKETGYAFMPIRYSLHDYLEIPVQLHISNLSDKDDISIFCGRAKLSCCAKLNNELYDMQFVDLGFEFSIQTRMEIINYIDKFNINIDDIPYHDLKSDITWAIYVLYGQHGYLDGFYRIRKILQNFVLQQALIDLPHVILGGHNIPHDIFKEVSSIITSYICERVNPLNCNTVCLDKLAERPIVLEEVLLPYIMDPNFSEKILSLGNGKIHFRPKNLAWIRDYALSRIVLKEEA